MELCWLDELSDELDGESESAELDSDDKEWDLEEERSIEGNTSISD